MCIYLFNFFSNIDFLLKEVKCTGYISFNVFNLQVDPILGRPTETDLGDFWWKKCPGSGSKF